MSNKLLKNDTGKELVDAIKSLNINGVLITNEDDVVILTPFNKSASEFELDLTEIRKAVQLTSEDKKIVIEATQQTNSNMLKAQDASTKAQNYATQAETIANKIGLVDNAVNTCVSNATKTNQYKNDAQQILQNIRVSEANSLNNSNKSAENAEQARLYMNSAKDFTPEGYQNLVDVVNNIVSLPFVVKNGKIYQVWRKEVDILS